MTVSTLGELAQGTYDTLEAGEWCQRFMWRYDGKVCLLGAVNKTAYGHAIPFRKPGSSEETHEDFFNPATEAIAFGLIEVGIVAAPALDSEFQTNVSKVYNWNDNPARTVDEVKAALLKVVQEAGDVPVDLTPPDDFPSPLLEDPA